MTEQRSELERCARDNGAALFGVAGLAQGLCDLIVGVPRPLVARLHSAVVFAVPLPNGVLDTLIDGPSPYYFYVYRRINALLDQIALRLAGRIEAAGGLALPVPSSQVLDWKRQRGMFSHRHAAVAAGLGWFGIHNLLVTPEFGARLRLASVLTDLELAADALRQDEAPCASCRRCIEACPAGAIKARREEFDYARCFAQLDTFRSTHSVGQHICGLCQKACAPQRSAR